MDAKREKRRHAGRNSRLDAQIADLALRQHGVVHLDQLRELGLSATGTRSRVGTGRLHRVHRSVFAVGHPGLTRAGQWMAAVLACRARAALSHLSSAARHRIHADIAAIDVTVARTNAPDIPGVRSHTALLSPGEFVVVGGIPCTSLPRTLIDIAPMIGARGVERAIAEAQFQRTYDRRALEATVDAHRGGRGVGIVAEILRIEGIENTLTNQELEERFLGLSRSAGFAIPVVNMPVTVGNERFICDFVWPDLRLIVETDGRGFHTRERQFEEDRRRDSILKLAGWEVLRFTWRQVTSKPGWVVSILSGFMASRGET